MFHSIFSSESELEALLHSISKEIQLLEAQLKNLPDGKLISCKNGKYHKYYQKSGQSLLYIPKSEHTLAKQLALKAYLNFQLDDLLYQRKFLTSHLKHFHSHSQQLDKLFFSSQGYQKLLAANFVSPNETHVQWMKAPYEQNLKYPEQLKHKTLSGNVVRSKSESLIDTSLFLHKIPYRYECELYLNEIQLFPDFTVLHPHTGNIIYWEHFGMMDDNSYSQNAYAKMQLYSTNGIIPGINFITTFETRENPLTFDMVEKTIQHYLL